MAGTTERFKVVVDVHLILRRGHKILFGKRSNTGYCDGAYHLVSGHLDPGESAIAALIREAREEVGIVIDPADVVLVHVMHNSSSGGRIAFFFEVQKWRGMPVNQEPEKCAALAWFGVDSLPETMIPYARRALELCQKGEVFSVYGWDA